MEIRALGTKEDIEKFVESLNEFYEIKNESAFYPCRGSQDNYRKYIQVNTKDMEK